MGCVEAKLPPSSHEIPSIHPIPLNPPEHPDGQVVIVIVSAHLRPQRCGGRADKHCSRALMTALHPIHPIHPIRPIYLFHLFHPIHPIYPIHLTNPIHPFLPIYPIHLFHLFHPNPPDLPHPPIQPNPPDGPVGQSLERDKPPPSSAAPTSLRYPGKVATDLSPSSASAAGSGRLFISDSNNHRIVITSLDGAYVDQIGVTGWV